MQLQDILDNVAALSTKATTVLDDADKIIAENSPTIHSALANVDQFSKALADNSAGVDAALKSVGELGKQIGPLAARLQTLSDDADRLVQSIDTDQVRAIVGNVQAMSAKGVSVIDRADKLLSDNSDSVQSTLHNADVFSKALADNAPNVDTTLKNLAEISKTVQPVVAQIQSLSQDADRLIKAVEPDQIHALLNNAQTFSQALADSSDNVKALMRDGAVLAGHLNDFANRLDTALIDADSLLKAVDLQKIAGIVDLGQRGGADCAPEPGQHRFDAQELFRDVRQAQRFRRQGRWRADRARKASSARRARRARSTVSARRRFRSRGSLTTLNSRIKDIASGLSRFTNTGLREYEALAVQAKTNARRHRRSGSIARTESKSGPLRVETGAARVSRRSMMGRRGRGFGGQLKLVAASARTRAVGLRERPSPTMFDLAAASPPPTHARPGAVSRRSGDCDGRSRQRSHPRPRIADAGDARWRSVAPVAAGAFPRAASRKFPERGARPLDRRPGGERELRGRSRHPLLRARRSDEGSSRRYRRVGRLAWQRADRGGPDLHLADPSRVNRRLKCGGGARSGGFDHHERDRRLRRPEALMRPSSVLKPLRGTQRRFRA